MKILPKDPTWVSICDDLPTWGVGVIVCHDDEKSMAYLDWGRRKWVLQAGGIGVNRDLEFNEVSHWMYQDSIPDPE